LSGVGLGYIMSLNGGLSTNQSLFVVLY
jgi:hypothetical protein